MFSPPLIEGRAGGVCVSPTIKRMTAQTRLLEQDETWTDATVCLAKFLHAIHLVAWRNVNQDLRIAQIIPLLGGARGGCTTGGFA